MIVAIVNLIFLDEIYDEDEDDDDDGVDIDDEESDESDGDEDVEDGEEFSGVDDCFLSPPMKAEIVPTIPNTINAIPKYKKNLFRVTILKLDQLTVFESGASPCLPGKAMLRFVAICDWRVFPESHLSF